MNIEVVTKEDLQNFRQQLLNDLKSLLSIKTNENNEWLRSSEVRKLLKISPGTLQNLRVTGTLKPVKIGGILFYKGADIDNLLKTGE
jgi:hypothetical protein